MSKKRELVRICLITGYLGAGKDHASEPDSGKSGRHPRRGDRQ